MPNPLIIPLVHWLRRRRFPTLLKFTAAVFFINLFIPDPIPLIDDLLLALATLTLASLKKKPKNHVEPTAPDADGK